MSRLTDDQVRSICETYLAGGTPTVLIAEQYGVSAGAIEKRLKKAGIRTDPYLVRRQRINVDPKQITRLYDEGHSLQSIADHFGVTRKIVSNRLRAEGISLRPKNEFIPIDDVLVAGLYESGLTIAEISASTGFSKWCVNKSLNRQNVSMRDNNHPERKRRSSELMSDRMERYGCIRTGNHEHLLLELLQQQYQDVQPQYRLRKGGHHYDAYAGGILWELDEPRHQWTRQKILDERYDKEAATVGIEVRRIWEKDIRITGLTVWHNYQ
jgi:hypothetical protein